MLNVDGTPTLNRHSAVQRLNSDLHERALSLFMLVVFGHWVEHTTQAYQVFILGWRRPQAGGALGLLFPELVQSEVLHFTYNLSLLAGLVLLRAGFSGRARFWWCLSLAVQSWHFFEHVLLQGQWLAGAYLFGATQPTSILQLWVPRLELHLLYNTLNFVPMVIAMALYVRFRTERSSGC